MEMRPLPLNEDARQKPRVFLLFWNLEMKAKNLGIACLFKNYRTLAGAASSAPTDLTQPCHPTLC